MPNHPVLSSDQSPDHAIFPFDYRPTTRVVYGPGSVDRLGELTRELACRRALIVTDPGIVAAGHVDRANSSLISAGCQAFRFSGVVENPTTKQVADCVAEAKKHEIDLLIGLGGGSSMDTAKGANFLLTNGGKMADFWGIGKATKPMLPMIAIPTTAGTGSEAQSFALIADEVTHQKMACGDRKALCKIAILDPVVTASQPKNVTAVVGIDAIAHAVESFVTRTGNLLSRGFAKNAWALLTSSFAEVLKSPSNLHARGRMLVGANFAGNAIELSMLGAAHAAANPLTAKFNVTHGVAVGLMLPHVVRFNAKDPKVDFSPLVGKTTAPAGETVAQMVEDFLSAASLPSRLRDLDIPSSSLTELAADANKQWTAGHNPRPLDESDFLQLYSAAW